MFGERVFIATGAGAEGDKMFAQCIYNDTTGSLTLGMPLYIDVTDAAEWNNRYSGTALIPTTSPTGKNVVLGTNANAKNTVFIGTYAPENPATKPAKGDAIRVLVKGAGLVAVAVKTSGTTVQVGDLLITDTTQTRLLSGHNTYTAGKVVAVACATGSHVTVGANILLLSTIAVNEVINAYVGPTNI